jgi:hypothetical protein
MKTLFATYSTPKYRSDGAARNIAVAASSEARHTSSFCSLLAPMRKQPFSATNGSAADDLCTAARICHGHCPLSQAVLGQRTIPFAAC